jgi:uncharacterized protein YxjI
VTTHRCRSSTVAAVGILRHRNDEPPLKRFRMQTRLLSIGDDYWIEDGDGQREYLVDGKALRLRDTWELKDANRTTVARIKERKLTVRDKMKIELADGREVKVTKRIVGIRDHFAIEVEQGHDLKAHGNVVDHEYEIEGPDGKVAEISKRWFRVRDTYGVDLVAPVDPVLVLAVTVAIDAMAHGHD